MMRDCVINIFVRFTWRLCCPSVVLRLFSASCVSKGMPPKSKIKRLCAERARVAREGKKKERKEGVGSGQPMNTGESLEELPSTSSQSVAAVEVLDEADDASDFTFDPELDSCGGTQGALGRFADDWLLSLDRDTIVSLSLFLTYNLVNLIN